MVGESWSELLSWQPRSQVLPGQITLFSPISATEVAECHGGARIRNGCFASGFPGFHEMRRKPPDVLGLDIQRLLLAKRDALKQGASAELAAIATDIDVDDAAALLQDSPNGLGDQVLEAMDA